MIHERHRSAKRLFVGDGYQNTPSASVGNVRGSKAGPISRYSPTFLDILNDQLVNVALYTKGDSISDQLVAKYFLMSGNICRFFC